MNRTLLLSGRRQCVAVLLTCLCLAQIAAAQKFVLPILPDTQSEVNRKPAMFTSQLKWIVDNNDSLNIPFVLHVGDMVDFDLIQQYETASEGFKILDKAGIAYAITLGNHDTAAVRTNSGSAAPGDTHANVRKTDKFNNYFPVSRFSAQKGRFETNKSDNAYYTFQAGGLDWLVVTLEFCPRHAPVEWAGKIIAEYPNHNVIVLTHYHLNHLGRIGPDNAGYGDMSPQQVYDQMICQHPNVRLVISGHTGNSVYRNDIGKKGNHIYQILQDYQGEDFGGGYIRLLEIDPQARTMCASMYSPYYNKSKNDSTNQFSFSAVDFVGANSKN